ncbi:MAG TPA: DUF4214 domain-containing protein [Pseudonocardiaceae bacterium]
MATIRGRALVVVAVLAAQVVAAVATGPAARAAVPGAGGQFVAKLYSEGLGRAPDAGGWASSLQAVQAGDCSAEVLRNLARGVYTSGEFEGLGLDAASRVLALYRGVLNREPDSGGFTTYHAQLTANPGAWPAVVEAFVGSAEFAGLRGAICGGGSYGFGAGAVLALPTAGGGFTGGTAAQLQALLDATPAGGTVTLAQRAVVLVDRPVTVPPGVTLITAGAPASRLYARMGRLVRTTAFADAAVKLSSGSRLHSVWVDGRRSAVGHSQPAMNVQTFGGDGVVVDHNRFSEPAGWTNFQALGTYEGFRCGSEWVRSNLITAYVPSHAGGWTDGLSIACENTVVEGNHILDATDVSIVVFRAHPAVQRSVVRGNLAVNAGNSAYGGYVADGLTGVAGAQSFAGTVFDGNTIWASPAQHIDIVLSVGTRAWFGNASSLGSGAAFVNNTTAGQVTRTNTGIAVSGMLNAHVQANVLSTAITNTIACPDGNVLASISAGWASGSIQPHQDVAVNGCMGH